MERKTTKMLALVAVIGLCAVALIGAAYAAFGGTASTYNEGNDAKAGYMTLAGSEGTAAGRWAAITTNVSEEFSTYNYVTVGGTQESPTYTEATAYYFADSTGVGDGSGDAQNYKVKQIGNAKTYTIDNQTGTNIASINFKATASANPGNSDFKYFLKVTVGGVSTYLDVSTTEQETGTMTLAITSGQTGSVTVALCIGYIPDVELPDAPMIGPATAPATAADADAIETANAPVNLTSTSFAFTVEVVA